MNKSIKYHLHPSVFFRVINDKVVLYYTEKSMMYTFTSFASDILSFFRKSKTTQELIDFLKTKFQVDDTNGFEKEITNFLHQLEDDGILVCERKISDYSGTLENEISEEFVEGNRLYSVTFELTYRCNEHCRHCYVYDEGGEELTTKQVKIILDDLHSMGVVTILFTGGEVFVRDDIFEILEYAYEKNFAVDIFTNGVLLSGDAILKLKSLWPKGIHFSVYSHIAEKHDAVTQVSGSFEKTIKAIKNCRLVGIPVKIKMPVFAETANDITGVINLAKELGTSVGISNDITPKKNGDTSPLNMRIISNDEQGNVAKTIEKQIGDLYKSHGDGKKLNDRICSAGARMISINPYGKVFPCVSFPLCIGNVKSQSIIDIWNSSKALNEWRQQNKVKNRIECINCRNLDYCRFCPGEAMSYTGNPVAKYEDACFVTNTKEKIKE